MNPSSSYRLISAALNFLAIPALPFLTFFNVRAWIPANFNPSSHGWRTAEIVAQNKLFLLFLKVTTTPGHGQILSIV
jgi:hypothetical protein